MIIWSKDERKREFVEFLRSDEGRQAILELAPEILVNPNVGPTLNDVREQLRIIVAGEIYRFKVLLDRTLKMAKEHFSDFLHSEEGRRLMLHLVTEALARGELAPVLDGAETRLRVLAEEAVATHTAHAELSLQQSAEAHATAFKRRANEAARDLANQVTDDVQQQLRSYRGAIVEVVQEQLPVALRDEVARHVRSGPLFSPPCSNRTLAAAHGISIREVKRRRRFGYFD